ncbi:MAG TPA: hypothetical protein PLR25_24920 [Planctomycetaceae bacterium]|nr:hypothetical protein [Planctomycetaceae bacterium]
MNVEIKDGAITKTFKPYEILVYNWQTPCQRGGNHLRWFAAAS